MVDGIIHDPKKFTSAHDELIKGLQRALNVEAAQPHKHFNTTGTNTPVNGIISRGSVELWILLQNILPYAQALGEYNCSSSISQAFNSLNPSSEAHWNEVEAALFLIPWLSRAAVLSGAGKKIYENTLQRLFKKIFETEIKQGSIPEFMLKELDNMAGGYGQHFQKLGTAIGGKMNPSSKIGKFLLSRQFIVGTALAATGVSYFYGQYSARQQCQIQLKNTIRNMEGTIQDLKIQLEKDQKQLEKNKQNDDRFKDLDKKIEKLMHSHQQTFIDTIHSYKMHSSNLKNQLMHREIA
ncbi:MAG: hypothetical protein V4591_08160 [Bdellovibrionota bacterium]